MGVGFTNPLGALTSQTSGLSGDRLSLRVSGAGGRRGAAGAPPSLSTRACPAAARRRRRRRAPRHQRLGSIRACQWSCRCRRARAPHRARPAPNTDHGQSVVKGLLPVSARSVHNGKVKKRVRFRWLARTESDTCRA